MSAHAFDAILPRYHAAIGYFAWRLSEGDADPRDDLEQEGMIALWRVSGETIRKVEGPFIRRRLFHRMVTYRRLMCGRARCSCGSDNPTGGTVGDESTEGTGAQGAVKKRSQVKNRKTRA